MTHSDDGKEPTSEVLGPIPGHAPQGRGADSPGVAQTEDALRASARVAITLRRIPGGPADRIWGGRGSGLTCPVCDGTILPHELELELEFRCDGLGASYESYHLHVRCCAAWDFARLYLWGPAREGGNLGPR